MELQLYYTVLYLAGAINIMIALVLIHNNVYYADYDVYRRSRTLVAVNYAIFAVGFFLHAHFCLRFTNPVLASALSIAYFHSGGVLFGWSHISLMRPDYLTRRVVIRDLAILALGLVCYAAVGLTSLSPAVGLTSLSPAVGLTSLSPAVGCAAAVPQPLSLPLSLPLSFLIFFAHATYIAYTFYRTYYQVRRSIVHRPAADVPWWTPEKKRTVLNRHHAFVIGCHLIIIFGLGSIALTAAFPHAIWPYTVLTAAGIVVFSYIFYALVEYGAVIDSAAGATEDASKE